MKSLQDNKMLKSLGLMYDEKIRDFVTRKDYAKKGDKPLVVLQNYFKGNISFTEMNFASHIDEFRLGTEFPINIEY